MLEKIFRLLDFYKSWSSLKAQSLCSWRHHHFLVLKSEVDDLRILLTSADKQLDSLKKEKKEEIIEAGRKYAAIESKVK